MGAAILAKLSPHRNTVTKSKEACYIISKLILQHERGFGVWFQVKQIEGDLPLDLLIGLAFSYSEYSKTHKISNKIYTMTLI